MPGARGNTAGWGVLRATGGGPVLYSLRDLFATDRAAGAVNGTAAEPGPGTRTVVDTENKLTISGGLLTFAGGKAVPAWGDPGVSYPGFASVPGRAMLADCIHDTVGNFQVGLDVNLATVNTMSLDFVGTNINQVVAGGASYAFESIDLGTTYPCAIVLRSAGAFYLHKIGGAWKLGYINPTDTSPTWYPRITTFSGAGKVDNLRITDLPAPWNSDYGIATQRLAGARSAGDSFAHAADCLIGWTVTTLPSSSQSVLEFRQQDANNRWAVVWQTDGSGYLSEKVDGTPTTRGTFGAGSIANGQRMVVIADGATIRVYCNNVLKITYASADNFKTCGAGKLFTLGPDGALADLVSWPRRIGGAALAALNRA